MSRNLESLFEHLQPYAKSGINADPSHVFMICSIIQSAVQEAGKLDARTIPLIDQQHEGSVPENVVRFVPKIQRTKKWGNTPNPEDAA